MSKTPKTTIITPGHTIEDAPSPAPESNAPKRMPPDEMLETTRLEIEAGQKALEAYK